MALSRRSVVAIGVLAGLAVIAGVGQWYEARRAAPRGGDQTVTVHVSNAGDRGPGSLREALFVVAGATSATTIVVETPVVTLETALPALVNGRGLRLVAQAGGAEIDAHALESGPVLDVAGPNTTIEGLTVSHCPAAAVLVRNVRFRLSGATIQSCDVGVEVAANASDTLVERSRFVHDRIGIRFAAAGGNTAVTNNEFSQNQDAGVWAVRGAPDAHDTVIGIHDNKFTEDTAGIIAGNIPLAAEHNAFINSHEAAVHLVGSGAAVRGNRIDGGAAMGIVAENADGAVIEDNELEGLTAYGVMVRGSTNILVRGNRLHNCGYGLAFVLGDARKVSTAENNSILAARYNGIDVIGDSPILRGNQVLRPRAYALHVEDFQPLKGPKVTSQPFLDRNDFGDSPVSRPGSAAVPRPRAAAGT